MASTLDNAIKGIQIELKSATSSVVRKSIVDILKNRKIDPNIIIDATNKVINGAIGNILNTANQKVNATIAKAVGKKFKNSTMGLIAGNYAADVLASVIAGKGVPEITTQMSNAIADGLSLELYAKLPASLTKNIKINILGTKFVTSLNPYISKAVNDTMRAVIANAFSSGNSGAANTSIPGINKIPSLTDIPTTLPDLSGITGSLGALGDSITDIVSGLGSSASLFLDSIKTINDIDLTDLVLPAGVDLSRFTSGGDALGKMIALSSSPIGTLSKTSGLTTAQNIEIQQQLAASNINNPLINLGGSFSGIAEAITGNNTLSGFRSITKDLSSKILAINETFGVLSPATKNILDKIKLDTIEISKGVAKKASYEASNFKSMTEDQLQKLTSITVGFQDPNAKYPLPDYSGRTETNKLSTGDTENTVVDKKNAERMIGAQLPNGNKWDQPVSPYNAVYPYNHVTETESGHIIELDDTPGAERIHVQHKTGTFIEVDAIGNKVQVIRGSDYTIIDANGYISIHGKANVSVNGSCNVFIGSDANIEVNGNTYLNCDNNIELNAAGRLKLTAGEGIDIKSPEVYIDADNQFQLNADISAKLHTKEFNLIVDTDMKVEVHNDVLISASNNVDIDAGGTIKHHSTKDYHIKSDANYYATAGDLHNKATKAIYQTSGTEFHLKSGSNVFFTATGNINNLATGNIVEKCISWAMTTGSGFMGAQMGNLSLNTAGNISMDGAKVNLNSGMSATTGPLPATSTPASPATTAALAEATETEYCDASYITGRKTVQETTIRDSFLKQHTTSKISNAVLSTIMTGGKEIDAKTKASFVEDHNIDPDAIDKKPIVIEKADPIHNNVSVIVPDELPLGDTVVPSNWKLSPFFTLEHLTTRAVNVSTLEPVGDAMTLSKVTANLQYIALNVLEPVYAARPDMIVQYGFMPITPEQTQYTRNNFGLSVALDFRDATTFDDYYEIAKIIAQIVPFDEIILSYFSTDYTNNSSDSGMVIINVPGIFYPNVYTESGVATLRQWIDSHDKKTLKTWYNGKSVDETNLVKVT